MKLSRPIIDTIRFDQELNLIGNRTGVDSRFECDAYCSHGVDEQNKKVHVVGIRIRLSFYVDKLENEVAGYLSETESSVLTYTTPIEDISMLEQFATDVFRNIKHNLQRALPQFDLNYLDFPEPKDIASGLLRCLKQQGLYP